MDYPLILLEGAKEREGERGGGGRETGRERGRGGERGREGERGRIEAHNYAKSPELRLPLTILFPSQVSCE